VRLKDLLEEANGLVEPELTTSYKKELYIAGTLVRASQKRPDRVIRATKIRFLLEAPSWVAVFVVFI
jgi:hypothetical protein